MMLVRSQCLPQFLFLFQEFLSIYFKILKVVLVSEEFALTTSQVPQPTLLSSQLVTGASVIS